MNKILNQSQAGNIYWAFKSLEVIHMHGCDMRFSKAIVTCDLNGTIRVIGTEAVEDERYKDLEAFAKAYDILA